LNLWIEKEELRGELVKHKEVAKRQQEQLESQQGRIKQLEDMIASMAEKAGERKRKRDEAGDGRSAEAGTAAEERGGGGR